MTRNPLPSLPTRRQRRDGEWTEQKAVTFIVTLASRGNVTLAARLSGMSRKAAYALRRRDTGFARAWDAARATAKSDKGYNPPFSPPEGDNGERRAADARRRDAFFANLANLRKSHRATPSQ